MPRKHQPRTLAAECERCATSLIYSTTGGTAPRVLCPACAHKETVTVELSTALRITLASNELGSASDRARDPKLRSELRGIRRELRALAEELEA
ncbi:MAG: hypothetical protein WKF96_17610, partial [Solirubrobacteraceae bacterium]